MPDSGEAPERRFPPNADLWDTDFYAWCLEQAAALRACKPLGDRVDWERVAEEIEGVGANDHRACRSYIARIIETLLRLEYLNRPERVLALTDELVWLRSELRGALSPTLRSTMPCWVESLYFDALNHVSSYARHSGGRQSLPAICPYTWDDVLGREDGDWTPEPQRRSEEAT